MKKYFVLITVLALSIAVLAEGSKGNREARELAEKALVAHGGKSFREMRSLIVRGSVDITTSLVQQAFPATFETIFEGEKYSFTIKNPFQPLRQVYDGKETRSSVGRGFTLPPLNRIGMQLLQRLGKEGFEVSALANKKKIGFRMTSPEGYYSDFYLNKKTHLVKAYDSTYIVNNTEVKTLVEIDTFETKDGVVIPKKYAQRFEFVQLTVYAEFKAKEILVNTEIADDAFVLD